MRKLPKLIRICRVAATWTSLLVCTTSIAQNSDTAGVTARIGTIAGSYTVGNAFMGSVLVVDGDRVPLDKGYGMADLEWDKA